METKTAVKKIAIEDSSNEYFLFSQAFHDNTLSINLFNIDDSESYIGDVPESDLRCMAAKVRFAFNDFHKETLCALFLNENEDLQFIYTLEKCEDLYMFKWKKVVKSGMIVTLGCIPVQTTDYSKGLLSFMNRMGILIHELSTKLKESINELSEVRKEKSDVETLLEEAVKVKQNIEDEMYSKFLLVLNAKKRKIQELYEQVEELENKRNKKSKPVNGKVPVNSSVSSSKRNNLKNEPGPSTVKKQIDSSFLLDDSDDDEPSVPLYRPRRRKQGIDIKLPEVLYDKGKTVIENIEKTNNSDEGSADSLFDML